jgi:AcrR family transcriptional regulator
LNAASRSSLSRLRGILARVRAPKRRLSRKAESALSPRQLEILDVLEEWILRGGFADVTMAEIAKRAGCSMRTLYGIAPSKDALVLALLDRRLHRIGREAIRALDLEEPPLERLRAYLRATNLAVQPNTAAFSNDFARVPGAPALNEAHAAYVVAITRALLDEAVAEQQIGEINTAAVAHILGRLGNDFSRPSLQNIISGAPQTTADAIAEIIFAGLRATSETVKT